MSHGILSCASNRYHNIRSIQNQRRKKKKKMQTSNKKLLVLGSKSSVLPRRLGTPSKIEYNSTGISAQALCPPKPAEVEVLQETEKRASDQSISIFRARSAGSLFDHDSADAPDEEDDLLTLRMANPICDSSDDDSECMGYQLPTPRNEQQTQMWASHRLEEDDSKGFSLGALILI